MEKKIYHIYFYIFSDYMTAKWTYERIRIFFDEVKELFLSIGFDIIEDKNGVSECFDAVRGKSKLYCHPQVFSGYCQEDHIELIEEILTKAKSFSKKETTLFNEVLYLDVKQEMEYYRSIYGQRIRDSLISLFNTKDKFTFNDKSLIESRSHFR